MICVFFSLPLLNTKPKQQLQQTNSQIKNVLHVITAKTLLSNQNKVCLWTFRYYTSFGHPPDVTNEFRLNVLQNCLSLNVEWEWTRKMCHMKLLYTVSESFYIFLVTNITSIKGIRIEGVIRCILCKKEKKKKKTIDITIAKLLAWTKRRSHFTLTLAAIHFFFNCCQDFMDIFYGSLRPCPQPCLWPFGPSWVRVPL